MATNSQETPEYRTFREHYDRLVHAIQDPLPLAARLFARSIIDATLLQRVNVPALPPFQNTITLLNAILGKIQTDPNTFNAFLSASNEDPSMQALVESMERVVLTTTSGAHRGVGYSVASFPGPPSSGSLPTPQVQLGRSQGPFLPSQVQTASLHHSTQTTVPLTQPTVTASTNLTPPEMTTPPEPHMVTHTGEPLSTSSVAHVSENGGEEQEENGMSLVSGLEGLSVDGESMTLPRHVHHQHYQHHNHLQCHPQRQEQYFHHSTCISQDSSKSLHRAPFHPSPLQTWHHPPNHHRPPIQRRMYQPPNYPFHPPLGQPSYEHMYSDPIHHLYYQPFYHPPNLPLLQHSNPPFLQRTHPPSSHQQLHYQPVQPPYIYEPAYQHHFSHCSPPSLGKYQHPEYYQTSTVRLPTFQVYQAPLQSFYQAHLQAPVQPIYPYQPSYQPARLPAPQPDSLLGKYAIFLRGYYTQHHAPCTKWPQLHMKSYINLAVINNVYANRKDLVKFRQQTIRGCIDDILEWKAPIRMKDILMPNCVYSHETLKQTQYLVTQLLIEGAPGIGKSIFAWEVCQRWGQHQLFNEYSLVVLLKFRDKRVQEAKSVSDLLYHPESNLKTEIVHHICCIGGHGLLLILEGFDEAPASKRTMDSIFVRLFMGQELPKATVILTTRPSASAELRQFCKGKHSRRIEIVGFGKKEIDEYIQCAFPYKRSRSDFKEYLSLYPHIHSMMYVPLNSAIVTHVYESCKSSGTVVPKTMTQLYSSLIRTLLLRYLKDKEEYKDTCTNINSFKDLPEPVYDQFCEICKIAYTGIMSAETELIFQDLPSDFDPLGLMQTCPELYVDRGASVSYNFLHLTVQEYLAAYHISQQSRDEQVAFMKNYIFEMVVVVRFLAGLTELGRDLWDVVKEFASKDKLSINTTFLSKEENFIKLEILHLLFESQNSSAITSALGSDCVCFECVRGQQPFDWYVLGYCIAHSSCNWKLELDECELESVELFLKALNLQQDQCQLSPTGKIKEMLLGYKEIRLSDEHKHAVDLLVNCMLQLLVFHNLTHLHLVNSGLTSETCNLLSKHTDLLQHLEYLNLNNSYNIGKGGAVNLITSLTKFSTIRELHLRYTFIGFEDCKALSELLATSKYITVLDIRGQDDVRLSPDSVQCIIDGLSHNTSLETLDMSVSKFSSENLLHLASVLRVNTRLKELNIMWCNIQSSDSVHLAKALEENTTTQLQTLELEANPIGSEGAVALANMLATNKSLTELYMRGCSIHGEGAVAFASMLKKNQSLKTLYLSDHSVGVEGALELIESLKHNTTLEELKLSQKYKPPSFSTLDKTLQDRVNFW